MTTPDYTEYDNAFEYIASRSETEGTTLNRLLTEAMRPEVDEEVEAQMAIDALLFAAGCMVRHGGSFELFAESAQAAFTAVEAVVDVYSEDVPETTRPVEMPDFSNWTDEDWDRFFNEAFGPDVADDASDPSEAYTEAA